VITAIDRDITETGYLMPFFGKLAAIPLGPASIALRRPVPSLTVCVYRLPDDTYMAEAAPHVSRSRQATRAPTKVRATQELLRPSSRFIRRHRSVALPHRIWAGSP